MSDSSQKKPQQQFLFGAPPNKNEDTKGSATQPAAVGDDLRQLATSLPPSLRLGTSSWSFAGWADIVYAPGCKQTRLSREGLAAYAQHPLLRGVGLDRTFYAPIAQSDFEEYAASVPATFRFLVKAWSDVTTPRLRGAGGRLGAANPRWLDVDTTIDRVLSPAVLGLGDKLGPLLFQFSPQGKAITKDPPAFAARLHAFFSALPKGPCYAVELRDRELFTKDYIDAIAANGVRHCHSVHPAMPSVVEQCELAPPCGEAVLRWMLQPGLHYDEAKDRYAPFSAIVDPDPVRRSEVAEVAARALANGLPVTIVANNKAEGSAPLTLIELARAIRARIAAG